MENYLNSNILISIIIPVYNSEKFLRECLDSVLNQIYDSYEVILVDDGSTDNSPSICDEYRQKNTKIKVFHIENQGVSNARNVGIKMSSGEWISFVDSDDIISNDYCIRLIQYVDINTDLVIGRTISFIDDNINRQKDDGFRCDKINYIDTSEKKQELYKSIFIDNKKIFTYPHISTCSAKLIRKSLILDNTIEYDINMTLYEDAFFNTQVIYFANRVIVIDNKIYFYRMNLISSSNMYNENMIMQYEYVYSQFMKFSYKYNLCFDIYIDYFKVKNLNIILTNYFHSHSDIDRAFFDMIKLYRKPVLNVRYSILPKRRKLLKLLIRFRLYFFIKYIYK